MQPDGLALMGLGVTLLDTVRYTYAVEDWVRFQILRQVCYGNKQKKAAFPAKMFKTMQHSFDSFMWRGNRKRLQRCWHITFGKDNHGMQFKGGSS